MPLTGIYGRLDRGVAISVIRAAMDFGINHFDTAERYGPYVNEQLLGEVVGSKYPEVKIATKFGYKFKNGRKIGLDSRPVAIRKSIEGSLRRLRREQIDLLYQHRVDPSVPIEDVVGTMAMLLTEGKVASLGLCSVDVATLSRAQRIHPISAVQNEYSLLQRAAESVVAATGELGIAFVAHSPLARGILSGNALPTEERGLDDYRINDDRFLRPRLVEVNSRLRPLWDIARKLTVPPTAVALAWLLKKSPHIQAIPGARSIPQLVTSISATTLQLSAEDFAQLDMCCS